MTSAMSAAVVNHLKFSATIDPALFARAEQEMAGRMRAVAGFEGMHVVQVADDEVFLVIFADTQATLDKLAKEVGGPWMVANIRPLLAQPPQRKIGPLLASVRA